MVTRRYGWVIAFAGMLTMTVSYADRSTLAVLAPSVTRALGISESAYGWLPACFSAAYLVATPLSGRWIDRIGARRGLLYSVLAWSTVAALHAIAPGFAFLLALRVALGVTEGPCFPGTAQTMLRVLPATDRSRGMGALFAGSSIGSMIAPPLASFLFRTSGWRVAFLGTAAVGMLWVPLWIALTRPAAVATQLDTADSREKTAVQPRFWDLVSSPNMVRALIGIAAVAPVVGFLGTWGAKFLVQRFGLSQGAVGGYLWLPPLAVDAGALLFGDLAARTKQAPGKPARALFALASLLTLAVALMPMASTPWQSIAIAAVAVGGAVGSYTIVTADVLGRMPSGAVSSSAGILGGAQSLALIVSSPLIGRAIQHYGTYDVVCVVLGAWVVPGSLVWWWWRPGARMSIRQKE